MSLQNVSPDNIANWIQGWSCESYKIGNLVHETMVNYLALLGLNVGPSNNRLSRYPLIQRGILRDPEMVQLRSMGTNGNVENHIFQLFPTHSHNHLYYFSGRNPNQFYSLKVSLQQGLFLWELYLVEREVFSLVSPLLLWFLSRLYRLGLALS